MNDCGQLFNIPMCITSHPVSRLQNVAGVFDSARNIKDFTLDWTCNHGGYIQVPLTETTISLRRSKKRQIAVTQIINAWNADHGHPLMLMNILMTRRLAEENRDVQQTSYKINIFLPFVKIALST